MRIEGKGRTEKRISLHIYGSEDFGKGSSCPVSEYKDTESQKDPCGNSRPSYLDLTNSKNGVRE